MHIRTATGRNGEPVNLTLARRRLPKPLDTPAATSVTVW